MCNEDLQFILASVVAVVIECYEQNLQATRGKREKPIKLLSENFSVRNWMVDFGE